MKEFLVAVSIGPVQSYISQARKTMDLYAGSFILSDMTRYVVECLSKNEEIDATVVFPNMNMGSLPNRFVAVIRAKDNQTVARIMSSVQSKVIGRYEELLTKVCGILRIDVSDSAIMQVKSLPEFYWAGTEIDNYQESFPVIEEALGEGKGVRAFTQLEETGKKCSVCGERNALFSSSVAYQDNQVVISQAAGVTRMQESEALCAVCATKRFGDRLAFKEFDSKFPSTAHIASMDARSYLEVHHPELLRGYMTLFDRFDDELVYPHTLTDGYFQRHGYSLDKIEDAHIHLKGINKVLRDVGLSVSSYYALVVSDGDDMGKWISGEMLRNRNSLRPFHKKVTETLSEYAGALRGFIEPPKGSVVYTGGDDLLAFINLRHLFQVLKFVRDTYPHSLHNDAIISPSVSAGVCIAHYKAPLYEVLATSRQMEQKAKSTDGKDAIGIALMKRSGGMPQFTAKWYSGSRSCVMDIATVSSMLGSRHFSDACLHALDIEMRSVSPMKGNTGWPSMIETEMKRLVERASLVHRLANESEADFEARRSRDVTAMCAALNGLLDSSSDIEHFLSALDICVFLSRESSLSTDGGVLT